MTRKHPELEKSDDQADTQKVYQVNDEIFDTGEKQNQAQYGQKRPLCQPGHTYKKKVPKRAMVAVKEKYLFALLVV